MPSTDRHSHHDFGSKGPAVSVRHSRPHRKTFPCPSHPSGCHFQPRQKTCRRHRRSTGNRPRRRQTRCRCQRHRKAYRSRLHRSEHLCRLGHKTCWLGRSASLHRPISSHRRLRPPWPFQHCPDHRRGCCLSIASDRSWRHGLLCPRGTPHPVRHRQSSDLDRHRRPIGRCHRCP